MKRVTLRDLAKATNLSIGTISLALRNQPGVTEANRARILKAAERLGYIPDPMLSSLSSYRWAQQKISYRGALAWLDNSKTEDQYHAKLKSSVMLAAIRLEAQKLGYSMDTFWAQQPGVGPDRLKRILLARNIHGIFLAPQPRPRYVIRFDPTHFSVVSFGYSLVSPRFHGVAFDEFRAARTMLREMRRLGYRRIGMLIPKHQDIRRDGLWTAALLYEQQNYPDHERIPIFTDLEESRFRDWFHQQRPDSMVFYGYGHLIDWLDRLGLKIPDDIGVATSVFDRKATHFAGIEMRFDLQAAAALQLMAGMLFHQQRGIPRDPQRILIQGNWIQGSTVRKMR
jgi:LacI family transcriptional regulator